MIEYFFHLAQNDIGRTSGADSPMSVGSPAGLGRGVALEGALKARVPTPAQFKDKDEGSSEEEEEDMDTTTESAQDSQQ